MTIDEAVDRTRAAMLDVVAAMWEMRVHLAWINGADAATEAQIDAASYARLDYVDEACAWLRNEFIEALGPDGDVPASALRVLPDCFQVTRH